MKLFIKQLFVSLIDFFFPPSCMICGNYLNNEIYICPFCLNELELHKNDSKTSISVFSYNDKIKLLIHELKYNHRPEIGYILGREMGKRLSGMIETGNSVLLPIPLHKKRLRKRGYNQSENISDGFSEILNIPVKKDLLVRKKNNVSQTSLNAKMRAENVKGIFDINETGLDKNTMIFLIDDLITTGATTKEAVSVLKKHGFSDFFSLSVATSTK